MKFNNMKSIFSPRTRITQTVLAENPLRPWQRYIAAFMAYFFLLQLCLPTVAIAATLFSSDDFARVLNSPTYRATGKASGAMYARPSYLQVDTQSGVTIASFYTQLSPTKEALPDTTLVIGDEFVQQRLIRAQLNMMLGRTLINKEGLLLNNDNKKAFELDQNDALFAAGVQFGTNAAKAFGTPLVAQDAIVNNMIWPEKRIINGAEVIIPVVYLNPATLATKPEGHYIQFGLSTLFNNLEVNRGVVVSALGNENYQAVINSLNDIKNAGNINGSGNLKLVAGNMLLNLSGQIKANNNLDITTKRGDVINKTLLLPYHSQNGSGTRLAAIATIDSANGNITITSGGGITYEGGISNALNGALKFNANGDIVLAPVGTSSESTTKDGHWTINSSSFELMQSKLTTKQMITLMAGGKITITASELHSTEGGIELLAKHGIYIADEQGHFQSNRVDKIGKTQGTGSDFESFAVRSVLSAGKGILLETEAGAIELKGAKITSTEGTQVRAINGKVRLLVTKENSQHYLDTVRKGTWTIKTVHEEYLKETGIPNAIVGCGY
jgi:filamentous hemagglutinin